MNRITSHQIHRLLHSIDARIWMTESLQLNSQAPAAAQVQFDADDVDDHHSTQVAEAVPPEPNPTARLLQLLDAEPNPAASLLRLVEEEVVDYPYEMELLRRNLEGLRLQSERKLQEQLIAERHLNQLNRDRAVHAATATLTAELQAKTKELDAVRRRYENRSIDAVSTDGVSGRREQADGVEKAEGYGQHGDHDSVQRRAQPSMEGDFQQQGAVRSTRRENAADVSDRFYSHHSPQPYGTGGGWAMDRQQQDHRASHDSVRHSTVESDPSSPVSLRPRSSPRRSMPQHQRQRQRSRALIDSLGSLTTRAEQLLEVVDRHDETDNTVLVTCPDDCVSGDTVTFSIDADDDQIEIDVIVPSGVVAGDEFEIQFDSGL
jgi:hypothetical protein